MFCFQMFSHVFGWDCFARVFCFSQSFEPVSFWFLLLVFCFGFVVCFLYLSVHSFISLMSSGDTLCESVAFLLFHGFFSHHILFLNEKNMRVPREQLWILLFRPRVCFQWKVFRFAEAFLPFLLLCFSHFSTIFIVEITKQTESGWSFFLADVILV